jgi:hypothetical protein
MKMALLLSVVDPAMEAAERREVEILALRRRLHDPISHSIVHPVQSG